MVGKQPKRKPHLGVDEYGRSRLHNAVVDGQIELVRKLILAGVNLDVPDDNGWTALPFRGAGVE
jgi:ankyrin repeat protein